MTGNYNIERKHSIKLLGVMLDEHIAWIDHVKTDENREKYWFTLSRKPVSP